MRSLSLHYPNPSRLHTQQCAVSRLAWMLAAIVRPSEQTNKRDRRSEISGIDLEKFNPDPIKSGWYLRLMPI